MNVPDVLLAGKTGTAQVRRITMAERAGGVRGDAALPFKLRDHSLFQGFAPANNPRYAASCILEHSRSEEHTSELQSLMRISYAVFCLKKKNTKNHTYKT